MKIEKPKSMQPIPDHAQKVFCGTFFDVYQWAQEMYDGKKKIFEKVKRSDTVDVIAFDEEGRILILEEQQPGKECFYTLPGGRIEEGEDPLESAKREMLEETGYETKEISLWHSYQPTSKVEWACYFFIAKGCKKISEQNLDGGEKIKIIPVTTEEFIDMIISQKLKMAGVLMKMLEEKLFVIDRQETYKKIKDHFGNSELT